MLIATCRNTLRKVFNIPMYKSAFYLMASSVLSSILSFAFWIVAARYYSATQVGLGSVAVNALDLIAILADLGFTIALIRFIPEIKHRASDIINFCFTISCLFAVLIAMIFILGITIWAPLLVPFFKRSLYWMSFIIFSVTSTLNPLIDSIFLARRHTEFIFIKNFFGRLLRVVLIIFFAYRIKSFYGIMLSVGMSMLFMIVIAMFWLIPQMLPGYVPILKFKENTIKSMLLYSIGNYLARMFLQVTPLVLPILVAKTLGAEKNAYFYIGWLVMATILIIPSSILNSLFAEGSIEETQFCTNIRRALKLIILMLCPLIGLIIILSKQILLIFGQEYSSNGTIVLRTLIFSVIPWSINYLMVTIWRIKKHTKNVIFMTVTSACFSLGMSYFFMVGFDLWGVGFGYFLGQTIVAFFILPKLRRYWYVY